MSHTFKPGDRVVVVRCELPECIGAITTITAGPMTLDKFHRTDVGWPLGTVHYEVDMPPTNGGVCVFKPDQIDPYRDDGSEPVAWTSELDRLCKRRATA